jgi:anti-anti-sigma factor
MDSTGLRVLLTEQTRIVGAGGSLRVLVAGDPLKRLFAMTGLTDTFQIDDSIHLSETSDDQSSVSRSQEAV